MTLNLETLDQLRTIFSAEQFILTGSFVANVLGLTNKEPRDIDILLVNPTKETIEKLKEYEEKFPKKKKGEYKTDKMFQIFYSDMNIDFFITDEKSDMKLNYCGFQISTVDKIVKAKKLYESPKHVFQLLKWRSDIISDIELDRYIRNA